MTHLLLLVLLGLVLKNVDLLALAVLQNVGSDLCTLDNGSSDLQTVICGNSHNAVKSYGFTLGNIKLLDEDNVTLVDLVLLSAGFDNSKHGNVPLFLKVSLSTVAEISALRGTEQSCGSILYHDSLDIVKRFLTYFSSFFEIFYSVEE